MSCLGKGKCSEGALDFFSSALHLGIITAQYNPEYFLKPCKSTIVLINVENLLFELNRMCTQKVKPDHGNTGTNRKTVYSIY